MRKVLAESRDKNSFLKLLLDETLCIGTVYAPEEWVRQAGGINQKLGAKRKYELLLRIAETHGFEIRQQDDSPDCNETALEDEVDEISAALEADCYIVGKYSAILQETGYFEAAVTGILRQGRQEGMEDDIICYLEKMIGHSREYDLFEEAVGPILIYKGSDVCNNMLNVFAEQLGQALEAKGQRVWYFDGQKESPDALTGYIGKYFKAIIGIQNYLFHVKMADGVTYLHERIKGPKLHLILDHPIWLKRQLEHDYGDFYVLSHDRNYVRFVEQYYGKRAIHFPIPGILRENGQCEKKYEITFVGSMGDYREQLQVIRQMEAPDRYLANRFLLVMRRETKASSEEAFEKAFSFYEELYAGEDKTEVFYRMRNVIYLVMDYYRYRILKTILDGGIKLDVFGDFWTDSLLKDHPGLICHPSVSVEESLEIFSQSRLSLNVMSWHKDGFTERAANIMLSHAVLVTDWTAYIAENYRDGEELQMFELDRLEELPGKIKTLLENRSLQQQIAEAGYQKTLQCHTWERRAEELLNFLEDMQ